MAGQPKFKSESLFEHSEREESADSLLITRSWEPLVDIFESEGDVWLYVELPGIKVDSLRFFFSGSNIVIRGRKDRDISSKRLRYMCMERAFGDFEKFIQVPVPINPRELTATFAKGLLRLRAPKLSEKRNTLTEMPLNVEVTE